MCENTMEWYRRTRNHLIGMDKEVAKLLDEVESRTSVIDESVMFDLQHRSMTDLDLDPSLFSFVGVGKAW